MNSVKKVIFTLSAFALIACSTSAEQAIKNIDFKKVSEAAKVLDGTHKDGALIRDEIKQFGKLCAAIKASPITMRHYDAADKYQREELLMAFGGLNKLQDMLNNGTIITISDKDKESIKHICNTFVYETEQKVKQ